MVQDVQQTQAQNNPYGSLDDREHPALYDTFERNWYEGYAAGFLVKTALGGSAANGAKNVIKSTDTAQSVGSRLADTKALQALSRVSDATDAAKARATARILVAVDGDAAEAMLSRADTAGGAYQLWRHQRAMDTDVDALSEARQERLGQYLLRTGDDGARLIGDLDGGDLEDFLDLDADQRHTLTAVDSRHDGFDASRFLRETDPETRAVFEQVDDATATRLLVRYGEGDVDGADLRRMNELLDSGDVDQADLQRLAGMLETKETNPFIKADLSVDRLFEVADRNGDLSETRWAIEKTDSISGLDGDIVWIENGVPGDDGTGWRHIVDKHADDFRNQYDSIETEHDIEQAVHRTIEEPDRIQQTSDGKALFIKEIESDTRPVTVYVGSNGFTQSAYPQTI